LLTNVSIVTVTDILIIGTGPAGLQAAIYTSRSMSKTIVVGKTKFSGLAGTHIENYCCMEGTHLGSAFLESGLKQVRNFGAEIVEEEVLKVDLVDDLFRAYTENGTEIVSKALIIATGVKRNRLMVKGEVEYVGRGVSYCVDCDANFFRGKTVAVIGEGPAAASGALLLKAYAEKIYLISEKLDVGERLRTQIEASEIKHLKGKVREIQGDQKVRRVILEGGSSVELEGIFIELGQKGAIELVSGIGALLNDDGYIMTNKSQESSVPGLFAAGDVCGPPFQVAKAVGEGCVAGLSAAKYVRRIK
jgi:thioredoxin reductase (NADPH)